MTDEHKKAIEELRSGNIKLASLIKDATILAVAKASEMIRNSDNSKSLKDSISVIESATKIVGLSPKEAQTNIQINAINGFEFIEMDVEEIRQLQHKEEFIDEGK